MEASRLKKGTLLIATLLSFVVSCIVINYTNVYALHDESSQKTIYEYNSKKRELTHYKNLFVHLQNQELYHEPQQELVLDAALYALVDKKIQVLQQELTTTKQALLQLPFHYLLNDRLPSVSYQVPNVDMKRVKDAWLQRVNEERKKTGAAPFVYNKALDHSAQIWAETLAKRYGSHSRPGSLDTHERAGQKKNGYDHAYLGKRFADHGIHTKVRGRSNYTENTGYGWYSCRKEDCTDAMIASIKSTFRYYMNEKKWMPSKSMRTAHYRSLISKNYQYIGMGLVCINSKSTHSSDATHSSATCATSSGSSGRYRLVIHYATDFVQPDSFEELQDEWYAEFMPL